MKKYLIIILLFPQFLDAQIYVPFISTADSSDTWLDVNSCTDLNCYDSYLQRYKVVGDTVIGPYAYAKLRIKVEHEQGADQSQWCTESVSVWEAPYGVLRETSKQIFIKRTGMAEYLAYDFNLGIGDTVPSPANYVGSEVDRVIESIDSVLIDGNYRKRYWISSGRHIVEGIGASSGFFNPLYQTAFCDFRMLCYTEEEIVTYFDFYCFMNVDVEDLSMSNTEPELIKIVDSMGREINDMSNTLMFFIYSDGSSKKVFRTVD
ncbi:MAG: hypothetical protein ACI837_001479 [Crocinitomicaceae bacterium]|jgi:hypothetical protein